jgi:hypothetical protein
MSPKLVKAIHGAIATTITTTKMMMMMMMIIIIIINNQFNTFHSVFFSRQRLD